MQETIINVANLVTEFGSKRIHDDISFEVHRGEVVALIGGSGSGKSTLLKGLIGLLQPTQGLVELFGVDICTAEPQILDEVRQRFGVLFQDSALFSALNVTENVQVPMVEQMTLPPEICDLVSELRLQLTGLPEGTGEKMPSELSGGMRKRVGLARALALEPELLFLDEPTSGLDPINARGFDTLIRTLSDSLGLTVLMVTHDLDSILSIADRVLVLGEGKLLADGTPERVSNDQHPWIREYFSSRRTLIPTRQQ